MTDRFNLNRGEMASFLDQTHDVAGAVLQYQAHIAVPGSVKAEITGAVLKAMREKVLPLIPQGDVPSNPLELTLSLGDLSFACHLGLKQTTGHNYQDDKLLVKPDYSRLTGDQILQRGVLAGRVVVIPDVKQFKDFGETALNRVCSFGSQAESYVLAFESLPPNTRIGYDETARVHEQLRNILGRSK